MNRGADVLIFNTADGQVDVDKASREQLAKLWPLISTEPPPPDLCADHFWAWADNYDGRVYDSEEYNRERLDLLMLSQYGADWVDSVYANMAQSPSLGRWKPK